LAAEERGSTLIGENHMTRWLGLILAVGIMFALLPIDWIETRLGFNADGGSGFFELLAAAIPLAIAIGLAARMWAGSGRMRRRSASDVNAVTP
jgi:hypothetical protein